MALTFRRNITEQNLPRAIDQANTIYFTVRFCDYAKIALRG
jgi:hypothetical protein